MESEAKMTYTIQENKIISEKTIEQISLEVGLSLINGVWKK